MDVCVVAERTRYHGPTRAATRLHRIIGELVAQGHNPTIVTPRWWESSQSRFFDTHACHVAGGDTGLRPRTVFRHVLRSRPSLVHLIGTTPQVTLAAGVAARLRNAGVVYEAAEFDAPIASTGRIPQWARRRLEHIIAPSVAVKTALREAGVTGNFRLIPDPVPIDAIDRVVPDDRADIVWRHTAPTADASEIILLGLAELRDHRWRAAVFDANPTGPIAEQARALGIEDRVTIRAHSTPRDRIAAYRGASTYVQTDPECPFPTDLVQAMAAGCKGIVQYQQRSSAHEVIERHGHGELISTPEELADAITAIAEEPSRTDRSEFSQYEPSVVVENLTGLYRDITSGSGE